LRKLRIDEEINGRDSGDRGAIIIVDSGFGHMCLGTRCRSFCHLYLTTMMIAIELAFWNTCEIMLKGLIGTMTLIDDR
jgi:hypothetical protein